MNILVVCQYYYPENFQITSICEELVKRGFNISVLTGLPNYPTGIIPEEYKRGHRDEIINGVHVVRVNEIGRKKGLLCLVLNYLSYWKNASKKIIKLNDKCDLVFVYQLSPVIMGLPAVKYKKKHDLPMITYVCDLWPESLKMYIKSEHNPIFKIIKILSQKVYSNSDKLICQSPTFIDYLTSYHCIRKEKIEYLPAFADDTYLDRDFQFENGIIDFVFLGNLGIAQNLFQVLKAIVLIKDVPGFKVHFVGDGTCLDDMKRFVKENDMSKIICFYGRRSVKEMIDFYELADVCMVSLKANNAVGLTLPSKVQGYMAAGKPIIGMIEGSTEMIIEQSKCGFCVKSDDVEGFSRIMFDIIKGEYNLSEKGKNGREFFKKNFTKEIFISKIGAILNASQKHIKE